MNARSLFSTALLGLSLSMLAACGGGGGSGNGAETAPDAPALSLGHAPVKTFRFSWTDVDGETEYRLLENPDGASGFSQVASIAADSESHDLIAFLPERLNARYILQACNSAGCSDSDEVSVSGNLAEAIGYLKADNAGENDGFGYRMALSADGTTLAVGATGEDSGANIIDGNGADDSAPDSGAVYVFVRDGTGWAQQAYIKPDNTGVADRFGSAVALSGDGNTLAVGAPYEDGADDGNEDDAGAVYLFSRDGGAWSQQAYLRAANAEAGDGFGFALALGSDGTTLAVGAPWEDSANWNLPNSNSRDASGAVYVFTRDGASWSQRDFLKAATVTEFARFGWTLSLSADGSMLAAGMSHSEGSVTLFRKNGGNWDLALTLKGNDSVAGDSFGSTLALDASGNLLAVGAPRWDHDTAGDSGAVYLFRALAADWSLWEQSAILTANLPGMGEHFGRSVSLSGNGAALAVGAFYENSSATGINGNPADDSAINAGAAYLFVNDDGSWGQRAYIKASNTSAGDWFGYAVALSADGQTLAVGANREASASGNDPSDDSAPHAGAVYLY